MIEAGLVAARFVHYLGVLALAGGALFPLYALTGPEGRAAGLAQALAPWLRRWLLGAATASLLSGLAWLYFALASMAGAASVLSDGATVSAVLLETGFGRVWLARLALAVVILVVLLRSPRPGAALAGLSSLLLVSLALVGHAAAQEGGAGLAHRIADAAHLLAAGLWLGALPPLAALSAGAAASPETLGARAEAVARFSPVGYLAVAALAASGLVNSWFLVGTPEALAGSPYGRVLLLKLALLAAMLAIAAVNRFRLSPLLGQAMDSAGAFRRLRRNIAIEQALAAGLILAVAALGTMAPPAES